MPEPEKASVASVAPAASEAEVQEPPKTEKGADPEPPGLEEAGEVVQPEVEPSPSEKQGTSTNLVKSDAGKKERNIIGPR